MPMSRTRPARWLNDSVSKVGRPKIFTKSAPATLNLSLIIVVISAFKLYDSRVIRCRRRDIRRAGMMKSGRTTSEASVIFHERANIAPRTSVTLTMLPMTFEKTSVNACCAPRTSLLSRETRAPVWVRVKKAMGIWFTCSNTFDRMS